MRPERRFTDLLRDLQQLERTVPRNEDSLAAQGDTILSAFLRHTGHSAGAVYLADGKDAALRLAARSSDDVSPMVLTDAVPDEIVDAVLSPQDFSRFAAAGTIQPQPHTLIPIRSSKEQLGLIALRRPDPSRLDEDDFECLRAASRFLSVLIGSQRLASELREGEFQAKYRLWELQALYDIGLSIASTLELDKLAEEILFRTISLLNARRAALYLRRQNRFVLHSAFGDVRSEFLEEELDVESTESLAAGQPVRFEQQADCIFPQCESLVAVPIRMGHETIGVIAASDREQRDGGVGAFVENDLRVLSLFANQVAIALENARLHQQALEKQAMEREIELAATIQRDILPRSLPQVEGFEIDALSRPARQLGGDYHVFYDRRGTLTVCVADVAGKSVPAAILVSALHAALQLLFDQGKELGEIATELNRHIHRWSSENKFITMFVATIDPAAQTIQYVNAGHNPAYVVSADRVEPLASHGLPIGILGGSRYKTQSRPFPTGSLLVAYSDGITEAEDVSDEEFGNARLEDVLSRYATDSCATVRNAIAAAVDAFVGEAPQKDDQTIVLVRSLPA